MAHMAGSDAGVAVFTGTQTQNPMHYMYFRLDSLKGAYVGDYLEESYRVYQGDTRSLDYTFIYIYIYIYAIGTTKY